MDIKQIKALIANTPTRNCISIGTKEDSAGIFFDFEILHGWDFHLASKCDSEWTNKNLEILEYIKKTATTEEELIKLASNLHMEDAHWRWISKALHFNTEEYNWFFYIANNAIQGVCLIYHPKNSAVDGQGIFYIEYIAVAPWNRPSPLGQAQFRGIGSELIKVATSFATQRLGLRPGFSLHSLPKACLFYTKIGMIQFPDLDKDGLSYFEMPQQSAEKIIGAHQ